MTSGEKKIFKLYIEICTCHRLIGFQFLKSAISPSATNNGINCILRVNLCLCVYVFAIWRGHDVRWRGSKRTQKPFWPFMNMSSQTATVYRWPITISTHGRWLYGTFAWRTEANTCAKWIQIRWKCRWVDKDTDTACTPTQPRLKT